METHMYAIGDTITMRLMKREKGSVIVQPYTPVTTMKDESQANQMYNLHGKDKGIVTCSVFWNPSVNISY